MVCSKYHITVLIHIVFPIHNYRSQPFIPFSSSIILIFYTKKPIRLNYFVAPLTGLYTKIATPKINVSMFSSVEPPKFLNIKSVQNSNALLCTSLTNYFPQVQRYAVHKSNALPSDSLTTYCTVRESNFLPSKIEKPFKIDRFQNKQKND